MNETKDATRFIDTLGEGLVKAYDRAIKAQNDAMGIEEKSRKIRRKAERIVIKKLRKIARK